MESDRVKLFLAFLFAVTVRWAISLNTYSGQGNPPLFGDYEAQRHWMEITYNLPINDWYVNGSQNDLMYWGLDYPPLTAYHSWIMGHISNVINPDWVKLNTSRGHESYEHKLFMRYSVLAMDLLVYIPAVLVYVFYIINQKFENKFFLALTILLYPGLILVDYGHFQYNNASLGLMLWAVICLAKDRNLLGSFFFVLALNYKQMELYHSLPFFCYLLGTCLIKTKEIRLWKLIKIGLIVISTFIICFLPFLEDFKVALQVLHRLFPFARGLFEDKVANFWCTFSLFVKIRFLLSHENLVRLTLITTLLALLPSSLHLLYKPTQRNFQVALINSSLIFFLFSFQVHEKSILLATLPVCLMIFEKPFECVWFLLVSTFSMCPLLLKDGLGIVSALTMTLFYISQCYNFRTRNFIIKIVFFFSVLGMVLLSLALITLKPPPSYPYLFEVLITSYSCGHFLLFSVYFHLLQFSIV